MVSTGETIKSDQDPTTLLLLQAKILLLRAAWLSGSTAKESGKHHCISPYNKNASCDMQVALLLVPLSQMMQSYENDKVILHQAVASSSSSPLM